MNDILTRILGQNWAFYTHQKLYDMVRTEAAGPEAMSDAEQAWSEFSELMATSRQQVEKLMRSAGVSWEGLAAESARDAVTPLLQWADDARTAGQASGSGLHQVIEAFAHTASAMPEPVEVTPSGFPENYVHLFGGLTDQDRQTRLAHEAKRRAVELMESYSTNTHSALSSLGKFVPPQAVTVRLGQARRADQAHRVIVTGPAADGGATAEGRTEPRPTGNGDHPAARSGGMTARHVPRPDDAASTTVQQVESSADPAGQAAGRPDPRGLAESSNGLPREGRLSGPPAPVPVPGAGPGGGGRHDGGAERGAGARFAARRMGATGMGPAMVPATATRPDREEDREHTSPAYLVTDHDDVWGEGRLLGPPVIGDEGTPEG